MLLLRAVLFFAFLASCFAQTTNATCLGTYAWAWSGGKDPCLIAAYLESQCVPQTFVPALPQPQTVHYTGPIAILADACKCSTVTYSMISMCGACQGHTWEDWITWSQSCFQVAIAFFPKPIPDGIVVPSWAFLDVTQQANNTFDPRVAQANATAPSSTSSSAPASQTSSESTTPPASPTSEPSNKTNVGAIAGGVVGGLAFVTIIGIVVFWFYFYRHRSVGQPTSIYYGHTDLTSEPAQKLSPPHSRDNSASISPVPQPDPTLMMMSEQHATSPISPITSGIYTTLWNRSAETFQQHYHGAPEV